MPKYRLEHAQETNIPTHTFMWAQKGPAIAAVHPLKGICKWHFNFGVD